MVLLLPDERSTPDLLLQTRAATFDSDRFLVELGVFLS